MTARARHTAAVMKGRLPCTFIAILLVASLGGCGAFRSEPATAPEMPMRMGQRTDIERRAGELEEQLGAGVYSGGRRTAAEQELRLLRQRLAEGDLRVGDQLAINLLGDTALADTATVRDQFAVSFAGLPDADLSGVLQSEIRERLQKHVDRYYKNITVRSQLLTRFAVVGEVARPGFYVVSPDRPVAELVMLAGGPTAVSNLSNIKVHRNGRQILSAKVWERAQNAGMTVSQLGLQSGDEIEIGRRRQFNWAQFSQVALLAVASFAAIMQILVLVYADDS